MSKSWKQHRVFGLVLATSLVGTAAEGLASESKAHSTIVLHVDIYVEMPHETLMKAENVAAEIFSRIGVETVWRNRSRWGEQTSSNLLSPQPAPSSGFDIRLIIIPRSMAERLGRSTEALGVAFPGKGDKLGRVAYVFYHGVEDLAKKLEQARSDTSASETQILAHAIAHEVGHLLLASPDGSSHSSTGIMRSGWSSDDLRRAARGELQFTRAEAEQIQLALLREREARVTEGRSTSSTSARAGEAEPGLRITLQVRDYAEVPEKTLNRAEKRSDQDLSPGRGRYFVASHSCTLREKAIQPFFHTHSPTPWTPAEDLHPLSNDGETLGRAFGHGSCIWSRTSDRRQPWPAGIHLLPSCERAGSKAMASGQYGSNFGSCHGPRNRPFAASSQLPYRDGDHAG